MPPWFSSFTISVYISLMVPIVKRSISLICTPSCTALSKRSGVVISRSVARRFFTLHLRLHIQSPELDCNYLYSICRHRDTPFLFYGKRKEPVSRFFSNSRSFNLTYYMETFTDFLVSVSPYSPLPFTSELSMDSLVIPSNAPVGISLPNSHLGSAILHAS